MSVNTYCSYKADYLITQCYSNLFLGVVVVTWIWQIADTEPEISQKLGGRSLGREKSDQDQPNKQTKNKKPWEKSKDEFFYMHRSCL